MNKPFYKCSESWITFVVIALGGLMSTGIVAADTQFGQVIGSLLTVAGALGYGKGRVDLKKGGN